MICHSIYSDPYLIPCAAKGPWNRFCLKAYLTVLCSPSGGSCSFRGFCWWASPLWTESAGPATLQGLDHIRHLPQFAGKHWRHRTTTQSASYHHTTASWQDTGVKALHCYITDTAVTELHEAAKHMSLKLTNGIIEWLSGFFVPNQCGLSLIGHANGYMKRSGEKNVLICVNYFRTNQSPLMLAYHHQC